MKKLSKLLCLVMVAVTALSMSVSASAESGVCNALQHEVGEKFNEGELVLVSSEERALDDGYFLEVNTYLEDGLETYALNKGDKKYTCTAGFKNELGQVVVEVWITGTFHWDKDNNTATVTNVDSGELVKNPSFEYFSHEKKNGDNVGGYWGGNRYAYVEHKTVVKNNGGVKYSYILTFDVDVNGDYHTNTHFKNANIDVTKG